jgi:hypothetical protein
MPLNARNKLFPLIMLRLIEKTGKIGTRFFGGAISRIFFRLAYGFVENRDARSHRFDALPSDNPCAVGYCERRVRGA